VQREMDAFTRPQLAQVYLGSIFPGTMDGLPLICEVAVYAGLRVVLVSDDLRQKD